MNNLHSNSTNLLTMKDLQSKGWSRRMVAQYLGEPDRVGHAVPGQVGRPGKYYCADRVRRTVESEPALAQEFNLVRSFVERNELVVSQRLATMTAEIDEATLPVLSQPIEEVLQEVRSALPGSVPESLICRLATEKLVGTLVSTVNALDLFSWHAGVCEARGVLRSRLLEHVAQTYPLLREAATSLDGQPAG